MAFFLIGRDTNGSVILLSSTAFVSRGEALDALTRIALDGGLTDGVEVMLGDTERTLPVLMLPLPPAPAEDGATQADGEPEAVDAVFAEAVMAEIDLDLAEPEPAEPRSEEHTSELQSQR